MKQVTAILFFCAGLHYATGRNNYPLAAISKPLLSESFHHASVDSVPLIFVDAPLDLSVATPLLPVKARCQHAGGCRLNISVNSPFDAASINFDTGDKVDTTLDLSQFNSLGTVISIEAISLGGDSANSEQWKNIYVDTSHFLQQIFAGVDQIFDVNYNKVLISSPLRVSSNPANPFVHRSRIVNIMTGDSSVIPDENTMVSGQLTNNGAVIVALDSDTMPNSYSMSCYDWNNNSLYHLGPVGPSESLHTAGDYAIWAYVPTLNVRNLQTLQNSIVSPSASVTSYNSVTTNGVVMYTYSDTSKQPLIRIIHPPNLNIPADTITKRDLNNPYPSSNIYRYTNNTSTAITNDSLKYNYGPVTDGVSIVYVKADTCCIETSYSPTYHIHISNGQIDSVISNVGIEPPFPMSGYQINNGFIAFTKPDSQGHLQIWRMDNLGRSSQVTFSGNFNTIERLNENGDIMFTNAFQVPNLGVIIKRYFANRATGQIREVCSGNGFVYYRDSNWYLALGRMLYKIDVNGSSTISPTPRPIISGLHNSYCANQGAQKIKILNLPDTSGGTTVTVLLDSTSLTIQPDSSFSINPVNLVSGFHEVRVLYAFSTNNVQLLQQVFTIRDLVKPEVSISSNSVHVTDTSGPIVITATNTAGGGSSPTYAFAKDRNFLQILQPYGTDNILNIDPHSLNMGINRIYVSMKTSDSCYAFQSSVDSTQIVRDSTKRDSIPVVRSSTGGLIDPDFPNQTIIKFPNPSSQYITITGISDSKTYLFVFYNNQGINTSQIQVSAAKTTNLNVSNLKTGKYWLSIYDFNKSKLIGTISVIKD